MKAKLIKQLVKSLPSEVKGKLDLVFQVESFRTPKGDIINVVNFTDQVSYKEIKDIIKNIKSNIKAQKKEIKSKNWAK